MSSPPRIIVTGLIAQHPALGGMTWHYLQYVLGLAQLGYDVYYFEDSGEWPYNLDGGVSGDDWVARDPAETVRPLATLFERYGLGERWAYRFPITPHWYGLSDSVRTEVLRTADLLLNVSGTIEYPERYRSVPRLVYIDSDPVFTQVKIALGLGDFCARVNAHDIHFSFGERHSSAVPVTGHAWRATRQPVVLSEWQHDLPARNVFTTVMSWTSFKPLVYQGRNFGQKDAEFRRVLDLPDRVAPVRLEIAMSRTRHVDWQTGGENLSPRAISLINENPAWGPGELLEHMGWSVVDSHLNCGNVDSYRRYIQSSKAEFGVAKNGYVAGQAGWFSDRSACYLAAGRPVVVQATGFNDVLPAGEGLLAFSTIDEAADAIRAAAGDYQRHARAALALAEEFFDARKVLARLIRDAMTDEPGTARG